MLVFLPLVSEARVLMAPWYFHKPTKALYGQDLCPCRHKSCVWSTHFSLICPLTHPFLFVTLCRFLNLQIHRLSPDSFDPVLGGWSHLSSHLGMDFGHLESHFFWSHIDGQRHHLTGLDTHHHPKLALPVSHRLPSAPWTGRQ